MAEKSLFEQYRECSKVLNDLVVEVGENYFTRLRNKESIEKLEEEAKLAKDNDYETKSECYNLIETRKNLDKDLLNDLHEMTDEIKETQQKIAEILSKFSHILYERYVIDWKQQMLLQWKEDIMQEREMDEAFYTTDYYSYETFMEYEIEDTDYMLKLCKTEDEKKLFNLL